MGQGGSDNSNSNPSENPNVVFEHEIVIRETYLDVFGHVNNAIYLQLFEEARWEIVANRGYGLDTVMRTHIGPTILNVNLQFRREIRNREKINIRTTVLRHRGKITTLRQVMINEKGEEACVADFDVGLFDMKARRLIEPTAEWKVAIGLS